MSLEGPRKKAPEPIQAALTALALALSVPGENARAQPVQSSPWELVNPGSGPETFQALGIVEDVYEVIMVYGGRPPRGDALPPETRIEARVRIGDSVVSCQVDGRLRVDDQAIVSATRSGNRGEWRFTCRQALIS